MVDFLARLARVIRTTTHFRFPFPIFCLAKHRRLVCPTRVFTLDWAKTGVKTSGGVGVGTGLNGIDTSRISQIIN